MREEDKLEQFTNDIMANVALKRQKVLAGVDKDIERRYKEKESLLYTEAYDVIQEGMKEIDREKNEVVSKAVMDNRILLFHKRAEIVADVFKRVRKQIRDFCSEETYYDYLLKMIKEDLEHLAEGDKVIYINHTDKLHQEKLEKDLGMPITIENRHKDFIGGCKIVDKENSLFIDDTFESKLMSQKEDFIYSCQIKVE